MKRKPKPWAEQLSQRAAQAAKKAFCMFVLSSLRSIALLFILILPLQWSLALPQKASGRQVIGYFTEGGAKSGHYTVKNMVTSGAAGLLTEVNYAFGRVVNDRCEIG